MSCSFFTSTSVPVQKLRRALNGKEAVGVAILVDFKEKNDGIFKRGLKKDIDKMSNVFKKLKFAVCDYTDIRLNTTDVKEIISEATTYKYPDSLKYICFYYTGHGGSYRGHPFIVDENNAKLHVMKEIVSPFYQDNAQHLGQLVRLFFFDCCLSKPLSKSRSEESPLLLSARRNFLIAFSTAMESNSKLDHNGSYWTDILSKHLTSDKSLSTILDITHEETVKFCREKFKRQEDIQDPHYVSCVGPVYLKG